MHRGISANFLSKRYLQGGIACVLGSLILFPIDSIGAEPAAPYNVTVWANAVFNEEGKVQKLDYSSLAAHAQGFLDQLRPALMRGRITPPVHNGTPASLQSGIRVTVYIIPAPTGSTFRISNLDLQPLPIKTYKPDSVFDSNGGFAAKYSLEATCEVSETGRCTEVNITTSDAVPESFRRAVRDAYKRWEFEPQRINGVAVKGKASMAFSLILE